MPENFKHGLLSNGFDIFGKNNYSRNFRMLFLIAERMKKFGNPSVPLS